MKAGTRIYARHDLLGIKFGGSGDFEIPALTEGVIQDTDLRVSLAILWVDEDRIVGRSRHWACQVTENPEDVAASILAT